MSDDTRLYRTLLATLGVGIGTLSTGLGYEIAPSLFAFKDGVDPTLQGAVVGGVVIGLLALTAVLIEFEP